MYNRFLWSYTLKIKFKTTISTNEGYITNCNKYLNKVSDEVIVIYPYEQI